MEVVILKMISGEEVIARKNVEKIFTHEVFKYEKARVIQVMQGRDGQPQATLAPYITLAPDAEFKINSDTVVTEVPAPEQVVKSYLSATSPIQMV